MAGPLTQNFSVPAGDSIDVNFDVDPDAAVNLIGSDIFWCVYEQDCGVKVGDPIIKKELDHGLEINDPTYMLFTAVIDEADTTGLLGNYYHEARITDGNGAKVCVTRGMMTVTFTGVREEPFL